jgi:hypothetical protein
MSDALRLARAAQSDDDELLSPLCKSIVDGTHQTIRKRDDRSERLDQIAALTARIAKLEAAAKRGTSRKKIAKADMD